MADYTVNRFRKARGRVLRAQIDALAAALGRDIEILDVGGRPDYWDNVGLDRIARVDVLNYDEAELNRRMPSDIFVSKIGDARNLEGYRDKSVDLVHSNSVIEHVGTWGDMAAMAREALRVGRSGWIQTPAWEFPIEPHFRAPFLHWFGQPMRRRMMFLSNRYRPFDTDERRRHIDRINLLSRAEVKALFPGCEVITEWVLFPKSYAARWMPAGTLSP